jgi:hypothetical protein
MSNDPSQIVSVKLDKRNFDYLSIEIQDDEFSFRLRAIENALIVMRTNYLFFLLETRIDFLLSFSNSMRMHI